LAYCGLGGLAAGPIGQLAGWQVNLTSWIAAKKTELLGRILLQGNLSCPNVHFNATGLFF
jgi:hypothetical protein